MKPVHIVGFLLLCVLSGSGWLLEQVYPSELSSPLAGCIHFLLIGLVALALWIRSGVRRVAFRSACSVALAGGGIFALPAIAVHITAGGVSEATRTALFCSIPLFTLLASRASSHGENLSSQPILASIIGIGSVVLLLSADLPDTFHGWLNLTLVLCCCALIALSGVWIYGNLERMSGAQAVVLVSLAATAALGTEVTTFAGLTFHTFGLESARCLALDLPVVWLTTFFLREIPPGKFSARFLLAPAVTALEGFAAMHARPDAQSILALCGMIAGGLTIFLRDSAEEKLTLGLR